MTLLGEVDSLGGCIQLLHSISGLQGCPMLARIFPEVGGFPDTWTLGLLKIKPSCITASQRHIKVFCTRPHLNSFGCIVFPAAPPWEIISRLYYTSRRDGSSENGAAVGDPVHETPTGTVFHRGVSSPSAPQQQPECKETLVKCTLTS